MSLSVHWRVRANVSKCSERHLSNDAACLAIIDLTRGLCMYLSVDWHVRANVSRYIHVNYGPVSIYEAYIGVSIHLADSMG